MTPDTDDRIAGIAHEIVAMSIVLAISMLTAVELDHQSAFTANEISEVGANGNLPRELEATQPAILKLGPHATFGKIVATPKRSCALGRVGFSARTRWRLFRN